MPRRSYRQHCALAHALDLVGERWTLLLVRDLLTGPKRYRDLRRALPGMGTNLLAARLRDLEAAGLVAHQGTQYALTPRGAELEPAVLALARFGAAEMGPRREGDLWLASWNAVALKYAFDPEADPALSGVLELEVDGEVVRAELRPGSAHGSIRTSPGTGSAESAPEPTARLCTDEGTFLALAEGSTDLDAAEAQGLATLEGDRGFLWRCLAALRVGRAASEDQDP